MIIDWFHFLFAVLLLWLPRQVLRAGSRILKRRHKSRHAGLKDTNPAKTREPGDPSVSFRTEFSKSRNYIDLLRAALGSVALMGGMPGIEPALHGVDGAPAMTIRLALYARLLILLLAVLIQSFRFELRPTMYAPIFFLTGLSLGLGGVWVALFAFILIWTVNMALPNPTVFLCVYALLLAGFAALFRGANGGVPFVAAALCFLPAFVSLLFRRPLVMLAKKSKPAGSTAAP